MKTKQRKTTETKSSFFHVVNLNDITPLGGPSPYKTKVFRHISKMQRFKKKGLTPQGGKAEMHALCDEAVKQHPIRKCPRRSRQTSLNTPQRW